MSPDEIKLEVGQVYYDTSFYSKESRKSVFLLIIARMPSPTGGRVLYIHSRTHKNPTGPDYQVYDESDVGMMDEIQAKDFFEHITDFHELEDAFPGLEHQIGMLTGKYPE